MDQAGCIVDTIRVDAHCDVVAACVGYEPPVADGDCRSLCNTRNDCDSDIDTYLCRLDCTPTVPTTSYRRACADITACGDLDDCLDLAAQPADGCAAVCDAALGCGLFAENRDRCLAECTGRNASPLTRDAYLEDVEDCLGDAVGFGNICVEDLAQQCFEVASCELIDDLIFVPPDGGRIEVNTANQPNRYDGFECGFPDTPEQVLAFTLSEATRVDIEIVAADYDTMMYLQTNCDDARTIVACDDDGGQDLRSRIQQNLQAGTYYLFVEGFDQETGRSTVQFLF
jgi:hypothetical protein